MKKITLLLLLFVTAIATAQKETTTDIQEETKHEIRLNTTNLIILKAFDVSYEYFINEEATVGADLFISLEEDYDFYKNFSLTPYYRHYFSINAGQKRFFAEGFGMLYTHKSYNYDYDSYSEPEKSTQFALGVSVGHKYVSNSGFVVQTHFGFGRGLFSDSYGDDFVVRGGLSFGFQF
ncbi:MAG: DUF3575 domain-containing protein [Polaribacter sp.]|nr:DUF3575 domain-containing protein [Polaribacter sp.]